MIIPRNSNYTEWKKHFEAVGDSIKTIQPGINSTDLMKIRQAVSDQALILTNYNEQVSKFTTNELLRFFFTPNECIKLSQSVIVNFCVYFFTVAGFAYSSFGGNDLTPRAIAFSIAVASLLIPVFNEILKTFISIVTKRCSKGKSLLEKAVIQTEKFEAILKVLTPLSDVTRDPITNATLLNIALDNCKKLSKKYNTDNLLGLVASARLSTEEEYTYKEKFTLDMISEGLLKKLLKPLEKKIGGSENFIKEKKDNLVNIIENTNDDLGNNIIKTEEDKNNSIPNSPVTTYIEIPKEEHNNGEGCSSLEIDNNKIDDNKEEEINPLEYFKHLENKLGIKELPWVRIGKHIFKRDDFIPKEKPSEHVIDIPNE
jgi:hypothetical protein